MNSTRRLAHALRAQRIDVQVVQNHDVDATVERPGVRLHVGLDSPGREQRAIGAFDRNVHHREGGDGLRLPVLGHLKFVFLQVADEIALLVGDNSIHLDVLDLSLEGGNLSGWVRRLILLTLPCHESRSGEQHEGCGDLDRCVHKPIPALPRIIPAGPPFV